MKNLKLILAVATIALLSACNSNTTTNNTTEAKPAENCAAINDSIVYIQMDSLINQYDMFNDLGSELKSKAQAIQNDLTKKSNALERDLKDFQTKLDKGLLTRSQAEEHNQRLLEKQQSLQNLSQQKQMEMAEEEAVMYRKVMDAIQTYLNNYNKEKGYALILTTSSASNTVMVGNPSLDITADVLAGLNEEYIKNKSKK